MRAQRISLALISFLFSHLALAEKQEPLWSHDYVATLKKSEETGKPVFVYFSGSNWCGFCKRFDAEIVANEKFQTYLNEFFEPLNLDFPRPAPIDSPYTELNSWLKAQHRVSGFPTILILDHRGAVLAKTGYKRGGPEAFIEHMLEIMNKSVEDE